MSVCPSWQRGCVATAFLFGLVCRVHPVAAQQAIIIDHKCTHIEAIPACWLEAAKSKTFHYAHTSHGSQITSGLAVLEGQHSECSYAIRASSSEGLPAAEDPPALRIYDGNPPETYIEPGDYWIDGVKHNWATEWCAAHPGHELCASCSCAHSQALNCNVKARPFWWMMARLAGWPGPPRADLDEDGFVSEADLQLFIACQSGPEAPYNPQNLPPECTLAPDENDRIRADLDTDGDVDQTDFGVFQRCIGGEGNPPDSDCAG